MMLKIIPPEINSGEAFAVKTSEGFLIDMTSSICLFGVIVFLIDTTKISKNPVENTKEMSPINTRLPPTTKELFI